MIEQPPCIKCKYYREYWLGFGGSECHHPKNRIVNPVTGKMLTHKPIYIFRDGCSYEDICHGNLFEPKVSLLRKLWDLLGRK